MITSDEGDSKAERFGAYITEAARAAGYDVDSPRGGGRTQLAKDTGMSLASVSRMLAGKTLPDPRFLEPLAHALSIRIEEILVKTGLVSKGALPQRRPSTERKKITAREAAADLGIVDPSAVEAFESMVKLMLNSRKSAEESKESRKLLHP